MQLLSHYFRNDLQFVAVLVGDIMFIIPNATGPAIVVAKVSQHRIALETSSYSEM